MTRLDDFHFKVSYIQRRIPLLVSPYSSQIRNATAHENMYLDPLSKSVIFIRRKSPPLVESYASFISLVNEMTSVTLSLALFTVIHGHHEWTIIQDILK